jgi:uncharacterized protein YbdZ (MbtH family)
MDQDEREDITIYKVVVNHEEQYSIWPADRENPLGWMDGGKSGLKDECLAYIKEVWTDMRPLRLRKKMEEAAQKRAQSQAAATLSPEQPDEPKGDDLVQRLSEGDHPVEASLRPERTIQTLQECINRGYVHIKFTDIRGGTELGVRIDPEALDVSQADFDNQAGTVHVEGGLALNYVKVRCIADIDLQTFTGKGHLEIVEG